MNNQACELIQKTFKPLVDQGIIPGYAVQIKHKGNMICNEFYGFSDVASKKPLQEDSIYRIYSMTKMITSVAIMMLVEEGKLSLDDKLSKFIPVFAKMKVASVKNGKEVLEPAAKEITITDLLTHTSGFSYGYSGNVVADKKYVEFDAKIKENHKITLEQYVNEAAKLPLSFQPGSGWDYGISTDILGRVIEIVSGKSLDSFFAERIFQPLEMNDTAFFVEKEKIARFASVYKRTDESKMMLRETAEKSKFIEKPAMFSAGGGLVSTTDDYMKFSEMLLNKGIYNGKKLLQESSVKAMYKNYLRKDMHPFDNKSFGFGFNVQVVINQQARQIPGSVGTYDWGGSAGTRFIINPQQELVGIFMTQLLDNRSLKLDAKFREIMYKIIEQ